ncbi:RNA recognition motif domain-containing protein [Vibrio palustris]|uniref:RNA recognition motif. (A.k.a. RRM, RBD, or RNP domain) n=1 Tax=Vibrio palustris TaxID=1918946 RepID=A0A1R4B888_9VIBR|nr:RNA-binding protein [Vibrio palustris]SJL85132.1 RNA recognition motif. (a.k.a. RRM, RBD, or RNP domain) [Vibrio palustris]
MNFTKDILITVVLALIGAILFSQVSVSPAISFLIGVVLTALVFTWTKKTPAPQHEEPTSDNMSTTTLYVGNLPYKANETNVRDLFAEHGDVFAVRLMKDKRTGKRRGFGFVVMSSASADQTINALNEADYMQRTLKVRVANDPKHPSGTDSFE